MNYSVKARSHSNFGAWRGGFTLVEMLVTMAVLLTMLTFLAAMMQTASDTWMLSREKLDNFSRGRALINAINRDLVSAVIRQDLPAFTDNTGSPTLAFYTREIGAPTGNSEPPPYRPLSYVRYNLSTGTYALQRTEISYDFSTAGAYATPVSWSPFSGSSAEGPSLGNATPEVLCAGVYGFAFQFLQTDGSVSSAFVPQYVAGQSTPNANPTYAVRISLAIVSDQAGSLLTTSQKSTLAAGLAESIPDPSQSGTSTKAAWDSYIPTLGGKNYSPTILNGIRTYERVTNLQVSPVCISQ